MPGDRKAVLDGPDIREHQPGGTTGGRVRVCASAGGRVRLSVPWLVRRPDLAGSTAEKVARIGGVRATRVFSRTGNVVVWTDGSSELDGLINTLQAPGAAHSRRRVPSRRAAAGMVRGRLVAGLLVIAGAAVARCFLRRAPVGRGASGVFGLAAAFIGFPFLRRAGRDLAMRRAPGTDALVTAATAVSLVLRQNIVAVSVLTVLNLGELVLVVRGVLWFGSQAAEVARLSGICTSKRRWIQGLVPSGAEGLIPAYIVAAMCCGGVGWV
ncbi:hypothetical protein ACWDKQ_31305 [Saccharopolyspora sp. NPDC000995]